MRFLSIRRASVKCVIAALLAVAMFAVSTPATFAAGGVFGTLAGTVVDASTSKPIGGASVTAKSPSNTYSATTDSGGHFTILGVASDTYDVTITAAGHDTVNVPGVNVFGDQINTVQTVALQPHLATIARVTSRSVSSAYQPTQTTDSYTINANQITQSTGRAMSIDENSALLSVPGVTLTNDRGGMSGTQNTQVTIRGAAATEIGYQFDGVPFREPFFNQNASYGMMNGVGSINVVEGAGDATQAGVGAGVINVIPARGSGPGSGTLDLGIGGPNFNHEAGITYGFSTPDNRLSEYVSYIGNRFVPYYGYSTTPLNSYGNYFSTTYDKNDQFLNNLFLKFGKDLSQQFQVLYLNASQEGFQSALGAGVYYPYDPLVQGNLGFISLLATPGSPIIPPTLAAELFPNGAALSNANVQDLIGITPGTPTVNVPPTTPQQNFSNQTRFLKLEYDNALSATTYLALRYYNLESLDYTDGSYSQGPWLTGPSPGIQQIYNVTGGPTVGMNLDLLHQFGSNLTVTLNSQYNVVHPIWEDYSPGLELIGLTGPIGYANSPLGYGAGQNPASAAALGDFFPGGYVYSALCGAGAAASPYPAGPSVQGPNNCLPRVPTWGINYNATVLDQWGVGLRFQYNPSDRLKFDLGVRDEGENQHLGGYLNALGQGAPGTGTCAGFAPLGAVAYCTAEGVAQGAPVSINNPYDAPNYFFTNAVTHPTVIEPRASVSYQFGPNNAVRFSYGRSAIFPDAQTFGTPFALYGVDPRLASLPAKPGAVCGWNTTATFPCPSYLAQLYWQGDNLEAPDAGNTLPAIYSNYDLSFNHLFPNGFGLRLTPFFKEGVNLPAGYLLNPTLGIFATTNQGFNKTTGLEFDLTTPQRAVGFSGFFAATYQNVLGSTPPFTTAENLVPLVPQQSLLLGDLYRVGYVSPFDIRIGGVENFKSGFSISPQIEFNVGYPYSAGNIIAGCTVVAPTGSCSSAANVPQVNFGPGITPGNSSLIGGAPGASISTNYYDPAYPGSALNPNIDATRGTPATSLNGGLLSHWNMQANLTLQYKWSKNTVGMQFLNLFGNAYVNSVPAVNPWYQPVATGYSGPQTNYNSCANQVGAGQRGCVPQVPTSTYAYTNGAYLLTNGNFTGLPQLAPLEPFAIQVYYQRSF